MTEPPEKEVMSWVDLGDGARALAEAIDADGYRPDIVLAIARGGLLVAGAISYALGVKNTFTMNVEFYTGIDERLPVPMLLPPVPDLVDFAETKVLIADDVADTGATLAPSSASVRARWPRSAPPSSTKSRGRSSTASTSGGAPTAGSTSPGAPVRRSANRCFKTPRLVRRDSL
jgi:hypothetical protein